MSYNANLVKRLCDQHHLMAIYEIAQEKERQKDILEWRCLRCGHNWLSHATSKTKCPRCNVGYEKIDCGCNIQ